MCTLTLALSSLCAVIWFIQFIVTVYSFCFLATFPLAVVPQVTWSYGCCFCLGRRSSLIIHYIANWGDFQGVNKNKKDRFRFSLNTTFFPSCLHREQIWFSLKHDTRVYCLKKQLALNFFDVSSSQSQTDSLVSFWDDRIHKGTLGFLCRLLWTNYTCTSPRPSTTPSFKWFWDTWSCAPEMQILSSRRCSTRISAR